LLQSPACKGLRFAECSAVRRSIALFVPLALLLALTLVHQQPPQPVKNFRLSVERLALPPNDRLKAFLGPFRVDGAWQLRSRSSDFFGYSSIVVREDGTLLAINDSGDYLVMDQPGHGREAARLGRVALKTRGNDKSSRDIEASVLDPATGVLYVGLESSNGIARLDSAMVEQASTRPAAMRHWGDNTGPEAMARLADGRFIVLREVPRKFGDPRLHEAVLFSGDPVSHPDGKLFLFQGIPNFDVSDMAMLPDGRALILLRRPLWPLPMRFAVRLAIADTRQIRAGAVWPSEQVAALASTLPIDNFEAIAVEPLASGRLRVWLMSDDNNMRVLQRTLLWKLSVDPADLPWPGTGAPLR